MAVFPFQYVNRRGIPVLKTTGVTVETTGVVFSFPNHAFANSWYRGLVLVELVQEIPAGTTGTRRTTEQMLQYRIFRGQGYTRYGMTSRPILCN